MSKSLFYSFIAVLFTSLLSCSKEDDEVFLDVDNNSIHLKQSEASASLSISSNSNWQITNTCNWLTISETNGEGNKTLKITATNNTSFDSRKCDISIKSGSIEKNISIEQDGLEYVSMQSLKITNKNLSLKKGSSINLTYDVVPSNATGKDSVQWISDNPQIATINEKGLLVGVTPGKCNITLKYNNGDITNTQEIEVQSEPLTGIQFTINNISLCYGSYGLLGVRPIPSDAQLPDLIYTSSNPSILSVDNMGNYKISEGKQETEVTVTVKTIDNKLSDVLKINVSDIFVNVSGLNFIISEPTKQVSFKAYVQSIGNVKVQGLALYDHTGLLRSLFQFEPTMDRYRTETIDISDMSENGDLLFDKLSTWTCDINYLIDGDPVMRTKRVKVNAHQWGS